MQRPEHASVADVCTFLRKALDAQRLYGAGHSQRTAANLAFGGRVVAHVGRFGPLTFEVKPTALVFAGEPVFTAQRREDTSIHALFSDHVRSITFERGVAASEVDELVAVWTQTLSEADEDQSFVTRAWDADFLNIRIETERNVLEDTEDLAAEDRFWEEFEGAAVIETWLPAAAAALEALPVEQAVALATEVVGASRQTPARAARALAAAIPAATPADEPKLRRMLATVFERFAAERRFGELEGIVISTVNALRAASRDPSAELRAISRALSGERALNLLLSWTKGDDTEAAGRVLRFVDASGAAVLADALVASDDPARRELLSAVLGDLFPAAAELESRVEAAPEAAALELLKISRGLPWDDAAGVRIRALKHRAASVRRTALAELRKEDVPRLENELGRLLSDADDEVRKGALGLVVRAKNAAGLRQITLRAARVDVEADERRRLIVALGAVGGPAVHPVLRQILRDDSDVALRVAAALALVQAGDVLAKPLLGELAQRRGTPGPLRRACEEALTRLAARGPGAS